MKASFSCNLLIFGVAAIFSIPGLAQISNTPKPFTITLSSSSSIFKQDQPIILDVVITNISATAIDLLVGPGTSMAEVHFEVVATDPNGRRVKERLAGMRAHGRDPQHHLIIGSGSKYSEMIAPEKSVTQKFDANKLYDFSLPGTYVLYVTRDYEGDRTVVVTSDRITINIVN